MFPNSACQWLQLFDSVGLVVIRRGWMRSNLTVLLTVQHWKQILFKLVYHQYVESLWAKSLLGPKLLIKWNLMVKVIFQNVVKEMEVSNCKKKNAAGFFFFFLAAWNMLDLHLLLFRSALARLISEEKYHVLPFNAMEREHSSLGGCNLASSDRGC